MAQNIKIAGATYPAVPSITVPKAAGGTASYVDTSDATATADKIMNGYTAYVDGSKVTGTGSGGDPHGTIWQDGQGYVHLDDESGIALQSKSVTPSESQQIVEAGEGYYALDKVTVGAISSSYVGSGVTRRSSSDLTAVYDTVNVPAGYYASQASKTIASGTEGTPSLNRSNVSNNSVTITPTVTNIMGYINGGIHTGNATTVTASQLVSGTYSVTSSGTKDVTNYASISVPSGTEGTPTATKGTVSNHSVSVTPSVTNTGGYISGTTKTGTAVTVSASELVSGTKTITENGTGIDVTGYASVDVAVATSTQHTATISRNDGQTVPYANVNSTGTRYQNNGQTFTWTDGDTIDFYLGGSGYSSYVYVNGVQVHASGTGGHYIYTPPSCDISLEFSRNTSSETSYVYITYDPSENDFLITFTKDQNNKWMPDCTYDDVSDAHEAGKTIVGTTGGLEGVAFEFDWSYGVVYYSIIEPYSALDGTGLKTIRYQWIYPGIYVDGETITYDTAWGNAVPSDVASGKVFYNSQGEQTGTATASSAYTLLGSDTIQVNTTATTSTVIGTLQMSPSWTSNSMIFVRIRDTAGRRSGYFYGSDSIMFNSVPGNGLTSTEVYSFGGNIYSYDSGMLFSSVGISRTSSGSSPNGYGVYPTRWYSDGRIQISARYSSTYTKTINGTFMVEVYSLNWPDGKSPFQD